MRRALRLARRGGSAVHPNPKVGCVIVKDGVVVGEGFHARYGGPHAEAAALAKAGKRADGATVYVSLEPCGPHSGKKTPPCADALIRARVARVVAACEDPNPEVAGRSLARLRRAGLRVSAGDGRREAERLNAEFFARMRRERPYVILKTALSLDGKAAAAGGASRWITGPAARRQVHALRASCDAILVGAGTVAADDPALTAHGAGKNPLRVVLASDGISKKARLLSDRRAETLIFSLKNLKIPGAETIRVPGRGGRVDLRAVLRVLARRGVERLLVEGGPTVHASFLAAGLVDEARVYLAPKLLSGARDPNAAPRVVRPRVAKAGGDFLFYGPVKCSRGSSKASAA